MNRVQSASADGEFLGDNLRARRTLESVLGVPATDGNHVDILRNGDEIFPAMLQAIDAARYSIDFLTFVYWKGEIGTKFAEALSRRARDGVRVRILLDAWGSRPIERVLLDQIADAGGQVHWFRPLRHVDPSKVNHRTHRKILVVDETVGFTGGVGISDLWRGDARNENEWRDTHFRVEGPCVNGLRGAFLDNWLETKEGSLGLNRDRFPDIAPTGSTVVQCVRGSSETGRSDVETLLRTMIEIAKKNIRVTTAYFVPDDDLVEALCAASQRGVFVQLLLPGPNSDKRFVQLAGEASYAQLLESEVELRNFQPSMLHAKILTVDGHIASVGSANFNSRSTRCDEELNLVIFDEDLTSTLDAHFDHDLQSSVKIASTRWAKRSLTQRVSELATAPARRWF
jgi:cardiolipin synthase